MELKRTKLGNGRGSETVRAASNPGGLVSLLEILGSRSPAKIEKKKSIEELIKVARPGQFNCAAFSCSSLKLR